MPARRAGDTSANAQAAEPWRLGADEIIAELRSDPIEGLTSAEAARRLGEAGPNEIDEKPPAPAWLKFARQFTNTMILVLLAAAVVTVVIGDLKDAAVILSVVTLNAAVGHRQERKAENAMAALKKISSPIATVTRDGQPITIPARDVVPGDVLRLEAGDVVAADARLFEASGLRVNESALTGESVPADKHTEALTSGGCLVAERHNVVFKGTAITAGRGTAVATGTGMATELGAIATLLQAHQAPQTPRRHRHRCSTGSPFSDGGSLSRPCSSARWCSSSASRGAARPHGCSLPQ